MDKNTITGLVLIGILLVGFSFLSRPSEEQIAAQKRYYDSIAVVQQQEEALRAKTEAALANEKEETAADSASLFFSATKGKEAFTTIQNNLVEITLDNKGGRVYSALLKNYMGQDKKPVVLFNGSGQERYISQVYTQGILTQFPFQLTNTFQIRQRFDITYCSANFCDYKVELILVTQ
jgi:YidC/Oxa1 family membrane protein insertase